MAEHWRAFDRAWFRRWQPLWLALLDEPLLGRIVRWLLCIRASDVGYRGRIIAILPHAYLVEHADGSFTADVRTHPKFAKRVYEVGKPIWWALHAWDWAVADRWVPALSAGFATLTAYPDAGNPGTTSMDGNMHVNIFGDTWANVRAANANDVDQTGTALAVVGFVGSPNANQWAELWRSMYLFDTSALTGAASVSAATLSVYGTAKQDDLTATPNVDVYTATPASNTVLALSDMVNVGAVSQTGAPLTYASWTVAAYNAFALNATGISNVATSGVTKFALRNANYDVANSTPPYIASTRSSVSGNFADQVGTTNDPKLDVTYTLTGGAAKARASWMASVVLGGAM